MRPSITLLTTGQELVAHSHKPVAIENKSKLNEKNKRIAVHSNAHD